MRRPTFGWSGSVSGRTSLTREFVFAAAEGEGLGGGFAVLGELAEFAGGGGDGGGGVRRDVDGPGEFAGFVFAPFAGDLAVGGAVRGADMRQVAGGAGRHDDVLEAGRRGVGGDAGKVFVQPDDEVAHEHDVVAGVHGGVGGVAVPEFPDGGRAVGDHVAPAGVVFLACDGVGEVGAAVLGEDALEVWPADEAGADVALGLVLDLVDEAGEDAGTEVVGHEA